MQELVWHVELCASHIPVLTAASRSAPVRLLSACWIIGTLCGVMSDQTRQI